MNNHNHTLGRRFFKELEFSHERGGGEDMFEPRNELGFRKKVLRG